MSVEEKDFYDKFSRLDEKQKSVIEKDMDFMLFSENEPDFVSENKKIIYNLYNNNISPLIAKVEVYQHDLPKKCRALLETTFRCLAVATTDESKGQEKVEDEYIAIQRYMEYFISYLYLLLINLYTKEVKVIKKTIKNFNYKGIRTDDDRCIIDVVDGNLKEIKRLKHLGYKKYKPLISKYDKYILSDCCVSVCLENIVKELEDAFLLAEETLDKIQKIFPEIISNGRTDTKFKISIKFIPKIISGIIGTIGIINIITLLNK